MLVKQNDLHMWYGKEITESKYNEILTMLQNRPTAPDGYSNRLTADLVWEQYEQPNEEI